MPRKPKNESTPMTADQKGRQAFKYRLYPNKEQQEQIAINLNCTRFIYNHFLEEQMHLYELTCPFMEPRVNKKNEVYMRYWKKHPAKPTCVLPNPNFDPKAKIMTFAEMSKQIPLLKKTLIDPDTGEAWLAKADASAVIYALRHLDTAFKNFYSGRAKHPKFKSKRQSCQSYTTQSMHLITDDERHVFIGKLGPTKIKMHRPCLGRIISATISRNTAGQFFCSISVDGVEREALPDNPSTIGLTTGINNWLVTSDGEVFEQPHAFKKLSKRLKIEQRKLSRCVGNKPGERPSKNFRKQQRKVARIHRRIAQIRENATHEMTRKLVNEHGTIITRTMGVQSMLKEDSGAKENMPKCAQTDLNRELSDVSLFEVNRQLEYKSDWGNRTFVRIEQDVPTAQTCEICGHKETILAKDLRQTWTCPECHTKHKRKHNGADNVKECGLDVLAGTTTAFATQNMPQ